MQFKCQAKNPLVRLIYKKAVAAGYESQKELAKDTNVNPFITNAASPTRQTSTS